MTETEASVHAIPGDERIISVVIPLYNEERNVRPLVERLSDVLARLGHPWEIVFALDPSPDSTHEAILQLIDEGYPIRLLTFSRRIGKPLSLIAGLDHAKGDACIIIDADLQDPPELIEEMVRKWKKGFQVVIAQRTSRKGEHYLYLKAAQAFYRILEKVSEVQVPRDTGDFRLLDARVVAEICKFRERHAFLRGLTAAAGFRTTVVPYERDQRHSGRTQISPLGAVNIALDGIVPFSRVPVRLLFVIGLTLLGLSTIAGILWLVFGVFWGFSHTWPIALLFLFMTGLSGIILCGMGILGEYLVRTYEETRDRPLYIIDKIEESCSLPKRPNGSHYTKGDP
jgi:glycosyltransferase involved in cell wall biosynthesis